MRKVIARRLGESKFSAPHFYLTVEINMDKAVAIRPQLNEISPVKISFNDIVVKACAVALQQHPAVNSSWLGDKIRYNQHINIGVAVAVDEGSSRSCGPPCEHEIAFADQSRGAGIGRKGKGAKIAAR